MDPSLRIVQIDLMIISRPSTQPESSLEAAVLAKPEL